LIEIFLEPELFELQKMRILFITNCYPTLETPGSSPCVAQQRDKLQHLGYDIDVLFIYGEKSKLNYLKSIFKVIWVSQICKKYQLIHAHYGYCGFVALCQFRCPVVVTFRGSDVLSKRERPLSRWVASRAHQSIVMTEQMKQLLGQPKARVIPYGIDFKLFKPGDKVEARRILGLPMNAKLILFPYDPRRFLKRYDLVVKATDKLKSQFPEIRVVCIYDKPHEMVAHYMNACDALILASDWEGAPVAIREAMACNMPIVSVDVGDTKQIIGNTEGCYICRQDPNELADRLSLVLKETNRTNGRQAILDLDIMKTAAKVADIYRELLIQPS
jgi:glycosyltransferase involved in cell wall biosynthesis